MENHRMSPLGWLGVALILAIGLMVAFGTLNMASYG